MRSFAAPQREIAARPGMRSGPARLMSLALLGVLLSACAGVPPTTAPTPSPGPATTPSPRPPTTPTSTPGLTPGTTPGATTIGPTPSPVPSPVPSTVPSPVGAADGVRKLVADLEAAGATVKVGDTFMGDPLSRDAVNICVGSEEMKVYAYASAAERAAVSGTIDPNDATKIGTSIVEWDGTPKFWARDRILVLYLGTDAPTIKLLISVLGSSISHGQGRPRLLPGSCPG
jgi:hypothetical protein